MNPPRDTLRSSCPSQRQTRRQTKSTRRNNSKNNDNNYHDESIEEGKESSTIVEVEDQGEEESQYHPALSSVVVVNVRLRKRYGSKL